MLEKLFKTCRRHMSLLLKILLLPALALELQDLHRRGNQIPKLIQSMDGRGNQTQEPLPIGAITLSSGITIQITPEHIMKTQLLHLLLQLSGNCCSNAVLGLEVVLCTGSRQQTCAFVCHSGLYTCCWLSLPRQCISGGMGPTVREPNRRSESTMIDQARHSSETAMALTIVFQVTTSLADVFFARHELRLAA